MHRSPSPFIRLAVRSLLGALVVSSVAFAHDATKPPKTEPAATTAAATATAPAGGGQNGTPKVTFPDPAGEWSNFSPAGPVKKSSVFFEPMGTNGRSCATCHAPNDAWTATPGAIGKRFTDTNGTDPIFAAVDGRNCPTLPATTLAEQQVASSLLLGKGLIRVALTPPASAEFTVGAVNNPYGCSSTTTVSVYRRILPTANLAFLSNVMWDARESVNGTSIQADLVHQASDAILGHEQASALPPATTIASLVAIELAQFSAQSADTGAGSLTANGATAGPVTLASQPFVPGSNDPFGAGAAGVPPSPVFNLFSAWEPGKASASASAAQASVGRGEVLFNTLPIQLTGVAGLNDQTNAAGAPRTTVTGTCGTCHNAPNAGSNTTGRLFATGLARNAQATPDLPLITLVNKATGASVQVTDPGLALTTGHWADVGKFKVPTLRNLAARGPYFHNGKAHKLDDVVNFYNQRFNLNLTSTQHADLVAFLSSL